MYRWTDPIDPEGVPRRPEPPTDEGPAWLTDRPEPRSAYLFGDEPEQPGTGWADAPTQTWRNDPSDAPWARSDHRSTPEWTGHLPAGDATGHLPAADADRTGHRWTDDRAGTYAPPNHTAPVAPFEHNDGWRPEAGHTAGWRPEEEATDRWRAEAGHTPGWRAEEDSAAGWRPVTDAPAEESGRHRKQRRLPRPILIGGAAAAATLVVSLGVGAVLLPSGDQRAEPTAADGPVAVAPGAPTDTEAPGDALAAPSPTTSPSSARPSPTRTATPTSSRTTAPSRRLERSTAPGTTAARTNTPSSGISAELQEVVDLVNKERAKAGCKALTIDDKLMLAAQRHSQDQADHKTMSHDGSDGSDVGDRLDRVGYAWRAYGENVAWNQQTPAAVMDAWMNSPGHRANILNCSFTEIGVGVARSNGPYWTQDFATPR